MHASHRNWKANYRIYRRSRDACLTAYYKHYSPYSKCDKRPRRQVYGTTGDRHRSFRFICRYLLGENLTSDVCMWRLVIETTVDNLCNGRLLLDKLVRVGSFVSLYFSLSALYPRDTMLARVFAVLRQQRVLLSVCPSVSHTPVLKRRKVAS